MASWDKNFDTVLNEILTDYENQLPDVDRAVGSLVYIKSAAIASQLWGLLKYAGWISRQVTPNTADSDILERWAGVYGITRQAAETDAHLLERLLSRLRQPPAGGNRYDWARWAKEVTYVHDDGLPTEWTERCVDAFPYENKRGAGTIDLVLISDQPAAQGDEATATAELLAAAVTHIDAKRPLGIWDWQAHAATKVVTDVTMTVTGAAMTAEVRAQIEDEITAYLKLLEVGQTLYLAKLSSIAIDAGADNVTISEPATDITCVVGPVVYQRVWPGTVTVGV